MENIIKQIIEIDNKSKQIVENIEKDNKNLDEIIENQLEIRKLEIDNEFNQKLQLKKQQIENDLKMNTQRILSDTALKIEELQNIYNQDKQKKIKKIVDTIIYKKVNS